MALQLIIGVSGSGKTEWLNHFLINESLANPEKQYMILVPEQFTMETQKAITMMHPNHGTMNIDILSFVRLAHKVFVERGCEDYVVLDDMGKCVILQKAALKQEKNLQVFGRNLRKSGFISELKSMLSELYQYGVTPEHLETALHRIRSQSVLAGKLKDMITVYRAFAGELDESTITAEELLPVMCRYLPESPIIRNTVIALDGFTGFTPVQYQVLSCLLQYGAEVMVTVTADPVKDYHKEGVPHDLFYLSHQTVKKLCNLAAELEVPVKQDICLFRNQGEVPRNTDCICVIPERNRFTDAEPLAFLEKYILRFRKPVFSGNTGNHAPFVSVYDSPVEEVKQICEEIYRLVRKGGCRYREIAVITGDPEGYAPLFRQELKQYDIPCFIDEKRNLMDHPLVEYIRSLMEVVLRDFSYESVFRLLKSGLWEISPEDRDYLENYVIACGIRGHKRWAEPWTRERRSGIYTDFDRINRIREAVFAPLFSLYEGWKEKGINVRTQIEILKEFLVKQKIEERLQAFCEYFKQQELFLLEKEYSQAYELVVALLNEIDTLLGDTVMSLRDFSACFDSGLEEIRVGTIPACTDRLLIGDMERTRLSGIKVLFFAGVNEGQVPKSDSGCGIFTDYDKEQLLDCDIELSPTGRMNSFMNRFYLYLALTRPSDQLYISYVKADRSGKIMRPSVVINELLSMYPGMEIREPSVLSEQVPDSPVGIRRYLISSLADPDQAVSDPVWLQMFYYCAEKNPDLVEKLLLAVSDGYQEESLTRDLARRLYGQALQASVSRLEQQAACAFAHFLRYGLKLSERETFSFETVDMGNLFHSALERYFRKVKDEKLDITSISEEKRKALVHICVMEAAGEVGHDILDDSARNRWLKGKLERITDRTAWALGEQLKTGGYETDSCEVIFEPDRTDAFSIPLSADQKMLLRGRIDRIDTREDEDRLYVRIVDYKSGSKTFDLVSVYYGLQIQLVFYMEAAEENLRKRNPDKQILPGGVLYYNISDPVIDRKPDMEDEEILSAILEKLQMNGVAAISSLDEESLELAKKQKKSKVSLVSDRQFSSLQKYVHEMVRSLGQEITEGKIAVNPYAKGQSNACTWCSYKGICGFDKKRKGFGYRNLAAIPKEEIWKKLEGEEEEDGEQMDS